MKKIVLLCSTGMSTSLMVNRMREAAKRDTYECEINAYGLAEAANVVPGSDCVLIGPQIRFNVPKLQAAYPGIPIEDVDMRVYGTMNGEEALKAARKLIGD